LTTTAVLVSAISYSDTITLNTTIPRQHNAKYTPFSTYITTVFPTSSTDDTSHTTRNYASEVPANATEILVYVTVTQGSVNNGSVGYTNLTNVWYEIYTKEPSPSTTQYSQWVYRRIVDNQGWSYGSFTFWMPVTSDRTIYIPYPSGLPGTITTVTEGATTLNVNGQTDLKILGYR